MKGNKIIRATFLCVVCIFCFVGCTKDKNESKTSAATSISLKDKIPEEGIVDDMQDYIEILENYKE